MKRWNWSSLVAFVVLVAAIIGLLYRHSLLATHPVLLGIQVAAFLLMVWARVSFGARSFHATANPTEGGLVTHGPFRFVRHPIYAAILYFLIAALISHLSLINGLLVGTAILALGIRIMAEEHFLSGAFPEYETYSQRTKRVIPFVL